jgi:hypothetical protein
MRRCESIYFLPGKELIWLLIAYTKTQYDKLPAKVLAKSKKEVEDEV